MDLTREQIIAGEACGCVFMPATDAQVQRLTVQRRIFRFEGQPMVVTRDGGFFETHSTLARLIEPALRAAAPAPAPEPEPEAAAEAPAPAPAGEASLARAPRRRRAAAAEVPSPTVPAEEIEAAARTEAQEMLGEIAASGPSGGGGGAKVVRRFGAGGGGARQPRWMTAGKARRGRLK